MSLITTMRRQKAVYWAQSGKPDGYGRRSFAAPVEIDCRWVGKNRQVVNANGDVHVSDVTVYVDREMQMGDFLLEGELSDIWDSTQEVPGTPQQYNAREVQEFRRTPNFRATEFLLEALL